MSLCTKNRWTAGTSCTQKETNNSKELDTKLKDLMNERNKIDSMLSSSSTCSYKEGNSNVNQVIHPNLAYHK